MSGNEIEVRVLEVDVPTLVSRLDALGAQKIFEGEVYTSNFDYADGELQGKNSKLRLRKLGDSKVEFTYKENKPSKKARVMEEHKVYVDDYDAMYTILGKLGLVEGKIATKHRVSYMVGDIGYELDTLPGLPTYLEVEVTAESLLQKAVEQVGYTMEQTVNWTTEQILDHYKKSKKK